MHVTASFTHEGDELVYDAYGTEGPLLVYLHGLLLDSDLNRGIAEAVAARGHRVVLLDLLGHGRSDKPIHASAYRIDTYAQQVFALLDHLGVEQAVLGGMSLGANVSLFAASQRPERVQGLILEMPVLEWAVPSAALVFSPMLLLAHYARTPLRWFGTVLRRMPVTPFPPLNSIIHAATTSPDVTAAVLHGVLVGPVAPTVEARRQIEAPTLVIGHHFDVIHPFDDADNLLRQLPHARFVHARSLIDFRIRPKRLVEEIEVFLDDVGGVSRRSSPASAGRAGARTRSGGRASR